MEFDLTKVYSAETADCLKSGDKVYVSDSLAILKDIVEGDCTVDIIDKILDQLSFRFKIKRGNYAFAYLIEKAKEEKWRPFKNIDELTDAWIRITSIPQVANTMPLIWIVSKNNNAVRAVTGFKGQFVLFADYEVTYDNLFEYYTFLDGTPCGVKE